MLFPFQCLVGAISFTIHLLVSLIIIYVPFIQLEQFYAYFLNEGHMGGIVLSTFTFQNLQGCLRNDRLRKYRIVFSIQNNPLLLQRQYICPAAIQKIWISKSKKLKQSFPHVNTQTLFSRIFSHNHTRLCNTCLSK